MEDRYNVECCEFMHAHDEIVERVQKEMPGEDTLYDLTELFRIFGDSTRIRILYVLFEAEMCVCDIAALLGMTQSAISHQLKALKNARLVKSRRDGKTVFYSLADDHVKTIIDQAWRCTTTTKSELFSNRRRVRIFCILWEKNFH